MTDAYRAFCELEKLPDFLDGKAERACAADEGEPLEVRAAVSPIARRTPRGDG